MENLRPIPVQDITREVARLCREANTVLPDDVRSALNQAARLERSAIGRDTLHAILDNAAYAQEAGLALCQDGGVTIVFVDIGEHVHITGGLLSDAVNQGVAQGYSQSFLRGSILDRPFGGRNTGNNTPAIIHTRIVPGNRLTITVLPKGGGADNGSRLTMLIPADGWPGVREFVVDTVKRAGASSCPPLIVGVGIGATFDSVGELAKRALLRDVGTGHPDPMVVQWEKECLEEINRLGIGPQGYGGTVTALAVHIEIAPRHIASIPVAVNLQCHSARKGVSIL